jgi:hypothetical protein
MRKAIPRKLSGFWAGPPESRSPTQKAGLTWIEPEEFAYPSGGFLRRAYVRCPDGRYRVVRCSIADTYYTVPARLVLRKTHITGWITLDEKNDPKELCFFAGGKHKDFFAPKVPVEPAGSPEKVEVLSSLQAQPPSESIAE